MTESHAVLIYADTKRSPEMRREISHGVNDPFLYLESEGSRRVVVRALEVQRMREIAGLESFVHEDFGFDELQASGLGSDEIHAEIALRACQRFSIASALVPVDFPVALADHLRAGGIELRADAALFADRQRAKTTAQVEGIRRAQHAAEAAVAAVAAMLRAATVDDDGSLSLDGLPVTCERLKLRGRVAIAESGAATDDFILAHGPQTCIGHHMGSGVVRAGEPVTVDLGPEDPETGCGTDMTRTFVVGDVSDELSNYHDLVGEALRLSLAAIGPGVSTSELHAIACEVFEGGGYPTLRTKQSGEILLDGFFHTLGHGVGLRLHEPPTLGLTGSDLVVGDVIAVEPGCYRQGYGGVRLEDLVLVTEDGYENLTSYPYELSP